MLLTGKGTEKIRAQPIFQNLTKYQPEVKCHKNYNMNNIKNIFKNFFFFLIGNEIMQACILF